MDNILIDLSAKSLPARERSGMFQQGIVTLALFFLGVSGAQGKDTVAIFQPDLRAPYDQVFRVIINGIKETADFKVSIRKISSNDNQQTLSDWLDKKNIKAIIALGHQGLEVAKIVAGGRPVLVAVSLLSADILEHDNIGGISLAADPEAIIIELKRLIPAVKKIFVVYSPIHNDWLMQYAAKVAESNGIELKSIAVSDLRQAAIQYKTVLNELETERSALWLPLDPITVENRTILPLILRVTWDRNLTLISSNPLHAKRGALLSVFPKNRQMGHNIANTVNKWLSTGNPDFEVKLLMDLGFAINIRTAAHLAINLDKEDLKRYDLKFPQN
ncbi:MAG: hypothetical protein JKY90_02205 [Gammaproteobacteria bacterium]|nr:hypothetical protein [Gammaproteobacteria bacterium]